MNTDTSNRTSASGASGTAGAEHSPQLDTAELVTGALAIVGALLLLRLGPVRTLLKIGAVGAAGWATYNQIVKLGLDTPTTRATDGAARPEEQLPVDAQRLAEAWGAQYRAPHTGDQREEAPSA